MEATKNAGSILQSIAMTMTPSKRSECEHKDEKENGVCPACKFGEWNHTEPKGEVNYREVDVARMEEVIKPKLEFHTPSEEEGWEQALQFEVMEDYIRSARLEHLAKDKKAHYDRMREHFENLKVFIRSLLRSHTSTLIEKIEGMKKPNPSPAWVDLNNKRIVYSHARRSGFNAALTAVLEEIRKTK